MGGETTQWITMALIGNTTTTESKKIQTKFSKQISKSKQIRIGNGKWVESCS